MTTREAIRRARGRARRKRVRRRRRAVASLLLLLLLLGAGFFAPNWIESLRTPPPELRSARVLRDAGPTLPETRLLVTNEVRDRGPTSLEIFQLAELPPRESLASRFREEIASQLLTHRPQEVLVLNGLADFSGDAGPIDTLMIRGPAARRPDASGEESDRGGPDWEPLKLVFRTEDPTRGTLIVPTAVAPEPGTGTLLLLGLVGLAAWRRYPRSRAARAA